VVLISSTAVGQAVIGGLRLPRAAAMRIDDGFFPCRLCLEEQTIKNHLTRILRKLGVHSRYDAARVAAEHFR
jgi:hypothetical protein